MMVDSKLASKVLWCYFTEDCEPWAVFKYGRHDPASITLEMVNEALCDQAYEPVTEASIQHHYMVEEPDNAGEDGQFAWHWCDEDSPGAVVITGVRFL